jgi:hypothetical protein
MPAAAMQATTLNDAVALLRKARELLAFHHCSKALQMYQLDIAFLSLTLDADTEMIAKGMTVVCT